MAKRKTKTTVPPGRPSSYTAKAAKDICDQLADGRPIRAICGSENGGPSWSTVQRWLLANKDFRDDYAVARDIFADHEFERIREIEDQVRSGVLFPDQARVIFAMISWTLGKRKPKVYGDFRTQDINVEGSIHVKRIRLEHGPAPTAATMPSRVRSKKKP